MSVSWGFTLETLIYHSTHAHLDAQECHRTAAL